MIEQETAARLLEEEIKKGNKLAVAGHADLRSVKQLLNQCLENDIPAVLGPCSASG